jgi:hypothetical protein
MDKSKFENQRKEKPDPVIWDLLKGSIYHILLIILVLNLSLAAQGDVITDSNGKPVPDFLLREISFKCENVLLPEALQAFVEKTRLYLNYHERIIPPDYTISLEVQNIPAILVLKQILQNTGIEFTVTSGGQIVLTGSTDLKITKNYTISGFVSDAETGEMLIGTNIYLDKIRAGCTSNIYGFYSLTLPAGRYTIFYSYIGFETQCMNILLNQDIRYNIDLKNNALSGDTIIVTANAEEDIVKSTEIGTIKLTPQKLSKMPAFLGEQDILKTLHLLPIRILFCLMKHRFIMPFIFSVFSRSSIRMPSKM